MGRYSNRFVLCILVDGVVQKDLANGEVHIPFGSEYTLRLINKNNRRAVADVYIDGENVGSYVVKAHDRFDVRRSAHKDAAFKFVDLESPEAYGEGKQGPNPDKTKGLVEVRFRLEKENPAPSKVEHIHHHHWSYPSYPLPVVPQPYPNPYRPRPWYEDRWVRCTNNAGGATLRSTTSVGMIPTTSCNSAAMNSVGGSVDCCSGVVSASDMAATPLWATPSVPLDEGCTVEGGKTGQRFVDVSVDTEEAETVLQLFLKGYHPQRTSHEVSVRPNSGETLGFCTSCGKARVDKTHQFCGNCGNKF